LAEVNWDKRYREGFYDGAKEPHSLLKQFWPSITGPRVMDIAMGNGRDLLFLAEKGFIVFGLEQSGEAIKIALAASGRPQQTLRVVMGNAESLPFKEASADAILVFYFLLRKTMEDLVSTLKRGGLLVYETFLKRQNEIDRRRNPAHLLEDGELISFFRSLEVIFYEEGIFLCDGKKRATARYVGRKR
jgi:tellurite methyltransferase